MGIDSKLIMPQVKQLYMAEPLGEITTGNSGDSIFEVKAALGPCILRVSEYSEKKQAHTAFQTRWIEYLSHRMEGIVKPVQSFNNKLYEVVQIGGKAYILSLQEKAPGKIVDKNNPKEFNQELFFRLGKLMGRMHKLTMNYEDNAECTQFQWNGANFWRKNIAILDEGVAQGEQRLLAELEQLPVDRDNYGIVHFDIHTDNFLVKNNRITLIDFDACQFNWYAADVASALFFMVQKGACPQKGLGEEARTRFAEPYTASYLKGYFTTNTMSTYWIRKLDLFMRYQMVDEYVAAQIGWQQEPNAQNQWYLEWHRDRIEQNLPYVFLDYEKILSSIPQLPMYR